MTSSDLPPAVEDEEYYRQNTRRIQEEEEACTPEDMITIETVSLRKGGWRNTEGFLSDLRHLDKNLAIVIFFAIITAILFLVFYKVYKSTIAAGLYTTSGVTVIAILFSMIGIDLFSSLGVMILR